MALGVENAPCYRHVYTEEMFRIWSKKHSDADNLFSLQCVRKAWVADGTHQISVQSHLVLGHRPTMASSLVHLRRTNRCQVSVAWSDGLLHIRVCCKSLASQMLLAGSWETEITVPHTANRACHWVGGYRPPSPPRAEWFQSLWTL
jgi:hypothetical protein